ncbi:hypothetical protein GT370_12550 [Acidocella sp. MX-AZ03]|nr:hypothetical protein [Acidocella sp. MX-AZ03]WBO58088.1 hypothetical protein GT370_12550 [Acidocella sp. MX-AZ03]
MSTQAHVREIETVWQGGASGGIPTSSNPGGAAWMSIISTRRRAARR